MSTPPPAQLDELVALRHTLHRHPEQSGQEAETSERIRQYLASYPPDELISGLGGHGLAAVYRGKEAGPTLLLRADLDALPIQEQNHGLPYESQQPGTSHKCGHDGHMAMLSGLAPLLHARRPAKGRVVLLYQPAEETGQGAKAVVDDPQFEAIRPNVAYALHNIPGKPLGQVLCKPGTFAAASVGLKLVLNGTSSHAAFPEEGRSPGAALAQLIKQLPALPSAFGEAFALCTVVGARLGEAAFGTSPGEAELYTTLRTFDDQLLQALQQKALALAEQQAGEHQLRLSHEWVEPFPATVNSKQGAKCIQQAADNQKIDYAAMPQPHRWSEDFGWLLKPAFGAKEGAMFGLGSGLQQPPLHNPTFDFPDALIPYGVRMFAELISLHLGWA